MVVQEGRTMSKAAHYDPDNLSSMDTQWDGKPERKVMSKPKTLEDRARKYRDITLEVLAISGSDTIDEVRIMASFARQVAREERERCAKACEMVRTLDVSVVVMCAAAI